MVPRMGSLGAGAAESEWMRSRAALLVVLALVVAMVTPPFTAGSAHALTVASVSPADGEHVSAVPVLRWPEAPLDSGVRVTSKYKVQIARTSDFATPVTYEKTVATNTASPEVDLTPDLYYWHYGAYDQDGILGAWSDTFTFTRDTDAAPSIIGPDDNHEFTYPQEPPTLAWSAMPGMDSYTIETAKDADFTLSKKATTTTNTTLTPTALLASLDGAGAPQPYYWRVQGNSVSGSVTTAWSDPHSFTIVFPGTPSRVQPIDGSVIDEPTFEWSAVPGASQYDLWVAVDLAFNNSVERTTLAGTRYTPTRTYEATSHFWKVRALDPAGSWGPWSPVGSFTRKWLDAAHADEVARPDEVTVTGADGNTPLNKFSVSWQPVAGASHYEVQISTQDDFPISSQTTTCKTPHTTLTPFLSGSVSGTPNLSACNPPQMSPGTRYVHVRAVAARNGAPEVYSMWSDDGRLGEGVPGITTFTFTANDTSDAVGDMSVAPVPATLISPADSSSHTDAPVLQWRPVANASFYSVYLYLDQELTTPALSSPFLYATSSTYFIPPASLPDNTAGQSYYWFVLPCTGTPSVPTCTPRNSVVNQVGAYRTFTKSGLAVAGAADSGASKPGTQEFGLSWDEQLVTSPSGGGVKYYQGQLSTGTLSDTAVNFTTDMRSIVLAEQSLTPGATYKWRVRAVDGSGIPLTWSTEQSFTAPTAPGPTVSAPATPGATPVLEWTPTAAQKSYEVEIYRGTDPAFPSMSKVGSTVSTPYTRYAVPTWLASGDHSWRVRTVDSHGKASAWTTRGGADRSGALLTFTVGLSAPSPQTPAAGATVAEPDLLYTWAPVTGAVKYRVEVGRGTPWSAVSGGAVDVVGTSYSPTTRLAAGDYSWRVSTMTGASGTNLMAASALIPFSLQTPPSAPGGAAATLAGSSIGMTWNAPNAGGAPIQGHLLRYKVGDGGWITQTLAGDAGSFTLNGVELASKYTLQVAAQNAVGRGPFSAAKTITTASTPGAPTLLKGTASGTKLTVTWSAPPSNGGSAITGYMLDYRLAGTSAWTEVGAPVSRTMTLSGLSPTSTYQLQVAAVNAVGQGPWAAQAEAQTGTATGTNPTSPPSPGTNGSKAPGAPGTPKAVAGDARATVTWAPPSADGGAVITGYTVTSSPGSRSCTAKAMSCVVSGLSNGTTYKFVVRARNSAGTSAPSAPSAGVTPRTAVVVIAKAVSKRGKLSVDVNPDQGTGYWTFRVQSQGAGGSWSNGKSYRTKGKKEKRTINLKKGVHRVVVEPKYGFSGTTSAPVTLVK